MFRGIIITFLLQVSAVFAEAQQELGFSQLYHSYKNTIFQSQPLSLDEEGFAEVWYTGADQVKRPYLIYVPSSYNPMRRTPIFFNLHGGVSRQNIRTKRFKRAKRNHFLKVARDNGWLMVFPYGQRGATWWDKVGMANIQTILNEVNTLYNVDHNRVFMGGFSDGASGSFHFAMTRPTPFAAFAPFNGHLGVGGLAGNHQQYVTNLQNRPSRATSTDLDHFYPNQMIEPMMKYALSKGALIEYEKYYGIGHEFDFHQQELPLLSRFLKKHKRDPLPHSITWKAADPDFGRYHWLAIEKIGEDEYQSWHQDSNFEVTSVRFSFGLVIDEDNPQENVLIKSVTPDSLAAKMGIMAGDRIVQVGPTKTANLRQFNEAYIPISGGQEFSLRLLRQGKELVFKGRSPRPQNYPLFFREKKSAAVSATYNNNTFSLNTSNVLEIGLWLHPEMVNFSRPVTVILNGMVVFSKRVVPNTKILKESWRQWRDRDLLFGEKLTFKVK